MPRQYFIVCFACALLLAVGCKRHETITPSSPAPTPPAALTAPIVPITNMVPIKAGSFMRGQFRVTLTHDFWIGKYEVTQGEYMAVMTNNPSHFEGDTNRPVDKVKFTEAQAYCTSLTKREADAGHIPAGYSYRLPTEAEWEYACHAGTTNQYSFGDGPKTADDYVWYLENSDGATHPVGQKKPNPWGLYDMHGNVWEWCNDWFAPFPATNQVNPMGAISSKFKVFKGGSWNHNIELARASSRFMMDTNGATTFIGFRVALGLTITPPPPQLGTSADPSETIARP